MKVKMNVIKTTKYVIFNEQGTYVRGFSNQKNKDNYIAKQKVLGIKGYVEERNTYEKVTKQSRGLLFQEEIIIERF